MMISHGWETPNRDSPKSVNAAKPGAVPAGDASTVTPANRPPG